MLEPVTSLGPPVALSTLAVLAALAACLILAALLGAGLLACRGAQLRADATAERLAEICARIVRQDRDQEAGREQASGSLDAALTRLDETTARAEQGLRRDKENVLAWGRYLEAQSGQAVALAAQLEATVQAVPAHLAEAVAVMEARLARPVDRAVAGLEAALAASAAAEGTAERTDVEAPAAAALASLRLALDSFPTLAARLGVELEQRLADAAGGLRDAQTELVRGSLAQADALRDQLEQVARAHAAALEEATLAVGGQLAASLAGFDPAAALDPMLARGEAVCAALEAGYAASSERLDAACLQVRAAAEALRHADLAAPLAQLPTLVSATLSDFANTQSAWRDEVSAAWRSQADQAEAVFDRAAARADAALSVLPQEALMAAGLMARLEQHAAACADAAGALAAAAPSHAAQDRLEHVAAAQSAARAEEALRLEAVVARMEALWQQGNAAPVWRPQFEELAGLARAAEAALALRATEGRDHHGVAAALADIVARLDRMEAAGTSGVHTSMMVDRLADMRAALAERDGAAAQVERALAEVAAAATRALDQGMAQHEAAERVLAAAQRVADATQGRRAGLATVSALAADCAAVNAEAGALARGLETGGADLARKAPEMVAVLQRGADDLRAAATAVALAGDALTIAA